MSLRARQAHDLAAILIAVAVGILVGGHPGEGAVLLLLGLALGAGAWAWGRRRKRG